MNKRIKIKQIKKQLEMDDNEKKAIVGIATMALLQEKTRGYLRVSVPHEATPQKRWRWRRLNHVLRNQVLKEERY